MSTTAHPEDMTQATYNVLVIMDRCTFCKAQPFQPCSTKSGKKCLLHMDRVHRAWRKVVDKFPSNATYAAGGRSVPTLIRDSNGNAILTKRGADGVDRVVEPMPPEPMPPEGWYLKMDSDTEYTRSFNGGSEFGNGGFADLQCYGGRVHWAVWVQTDTLNPYASPWASPNKNKKVEGGVESLEVAVDMVNEARKKHGLEVR